MADKTGDRFIEILSRHSQNPNDTELEGELMKEGYLRGQCATDGSDKWTFVKVFGITAKGRMFLSELERSKDEESVKNKLLGLVKGLVIFFAGVFASDLQQMGHALLQRLVGH